MSITMYDTTIRTLVRNLTIVSKMLDKGARHAEQKGFDVGVLLNARLAPDMFPLTRQVQIASDMAKSAAGRLSGTEIPKFDDVETTLPELHERIDKTIAFLKSVDAAKFDGSETRTIELTVRNEVLTFNGLDYLLGWVLPNFYFHVTIVYAILRHNGVDLGKRDFLGR